jgi:eukaryotic-like serine/threonine-protein kinase
MSLSRETHEPPSDDEGFAATVVEEMSFEMADAIEADGQALDDARLDALPTIGHVGRYVLKHQLGAGGLGTVYAAIDPLLSRPIAVKMLKLDAIQPAQRETLEQQLLTEARAAAGLSHPHIVTVYDAGLADQGVYVAMERLQGKDLRQLLAVGWRPDPMLAVRIVKRVADALAYAHSKGVIHCDVKPANVFMLGRTQPKLLDFGIARLVQQGATAVEGAGGELGSPYYAAPEQMQGLALDARVDVYALGVVFYEMLTGQRAFAGESLEQIRHAVLNDAVPSAKQLNPQVDSELASVVAKAMARDPNDRYPSARHLVRALRRWTDHQEAAAAQTPEEPAKHRSAWFWPVIALGLAGLIAVMPNFLGGERVAPITAAPAAPAALPEPARARAPVAPPVPATTETSVAKAADTTALPAKEAKAAAKLQQAKDARAAKAAAAAAAAAAAPVASPAASTAPGTVQLAISPWGEVEVDGVSKGTTPPLARLTLSPGRHQITVRNGDFAPHVTTITVEADKAVTLRHRFGS